MRATFAYTTALDPALRRRHRPRSTWLAPAACCCCGLALLVSGAASYVLLSRQRDAMSGALMNRFRTLRARIDEGVRAEDDR